MLRIAAILLATTALSGSAGTPATATDPDLHQPELVADDNAGNAGNEVQVQPPLSEDQQKLVDFALERFDRAGLELPSALTISFPEDQASCFGYGGVYMLAEVAVRICRPSDTTIVHELAHAWLETTLGASERDAFMELRGLATWTGGSEWDERGAEQAAEIVTWALMDRDITIRWLRPGADNTLVETYRLFKFDDSSYEELSIAYQLLTGSDAAERTPRPTTATHAGTDAVSIEARRS